MLLFWAVLAQLFGCLDQYLGQKALASFVGAVAFLLAPQCLLGSRAEFRLATHALVALITLVCALAWPPFLRGEVSPICGTFASPDTFAVLPMFGALLALGLLVQLRPRWRPLAYLQIFFLLATLWSTGCRGAIVGLGVGLGVFLGLILVKRKERFLEVNALLAFPLLVGLIAFPLLTPGSRLMVKLGRTFSEQALEEHHVRLEVATHGWKAVAARPVFGSGLGCFGLSYQAVRPLGHDNDYINIAHNDHVEIAVELGVLGALLWIGLFLAVFFKTHRSLTEGRQPVLAGAFLGAGVSFVVYSCCTAPLNNDTLKG